MLFDTHTHISHGQFDADREQVLARAAAAGVGLLMDVADSLAASRRVLAMAAQVAGCYAAVGIHPHHAGEWDDAAGQRLQALARAPKVRAIGEIGLDYYYNFSPRHQQAAAFRAQIRLARELGLPIIIHDRDAHADVVQILEEEGAAEVGGIMHCWSAGWEMAERVLALGFHLGFGGSVTYPKNAEVQEVAARVPLDRLLVETDCPYLAPVPHRGRRNEPAHVKVVAEFLAQLRGLPYEVLAGVTLENGKRLLGIA